jgi:hypothetical protein
MGFRPCVDQQDPFTRKVRDLYRANVVSAPRTGIDPLDVLTVRKSDVQARGRLATMVGGDEPDLPRPVKGEVAALRGERSTAVDVGLGVELTAKFFAALGVPLPSAKATASLWEGAHQMRFEVRDVEQHEVDLFAVGQALAGRQVARNPATEVFFIDDKVRLMVITRTLTSPSFAVHATDRAGQSVEVAIDGLADILGNVEAAVSWETEGESNLSFRGTKAATFAFAAVPCAIAEAGTLVFGLETADKTMGVPAAPEPEMSQVFEGVGLLSFDSDSDSEP